jgi:hypothetical protein
MTTDKPTAVIYTYFSYNDQYSQSPSNFMAGLLRQLLSRLPTLPPEIESVYMGCSPNCSRPELPTIFKLFASCVTEFSSVIALFDGLDECGDTLLADIVPLISKIMTLSIKVLVTTRPHLAYIEQRLGEPLTLTINAQDGDVEIYVKQRMDIDRKINPHLRTCIINKVVRQAQGM